MLRPLLILCPILREILIYELQANCYDCGLMMSMNDCLGIGRVPEDGSSRARNRSRRTLNPCLVESKKLKEKKLMKLCVCNKSAGDGGCGFH